MGAFQRQIGDMVELTPEGEKEIHKYKNNYADATKPLSSKERNWSAWDMGNLCIYRSIPGSKWTDCIWYVMGTGIVNDCIRTYTCHDFCSCSWTFRYKVWTWLSDAQ